MCVFVYLWSAATICSWLDPYLPLSCRLYLSNSPQCDISGGDRIDPAVAKKLEAWIRNKYEHKLFAPPGVDEPFKRLARGESLATPSADTGHPRGLLGNSTGNSSR